jgi:hypothetical protein
MTVEFIYIQDMEAKDPGIYCITTPIVVMIVMMMVSMMRIVVVMFLGLPDAIVEGSYKLGSGKTLTDKYSFNRQPGYKVR